MNYFSVRGLHREISATYSNVTTLSIFHPLPLVRDIVSVIILAGKCVLGEGVVREGTTVIFAS